MVLNHLSFFGTGNLSAITTVGGNATIQDTTTNAYSLLKFYKEKSKSNLEIDNIPVGMGSSRPIEGQFDYAYEFHGENGIGIDLCKYHSGKLDLSANEILSNITNGNNKTNIIALGPLTNIAIALKNDLQFRNSINSITIMGGAVNSKGNITPFAEFNIYNDPIAADYIFGCEIPVTLIPLNITKKVYVSKSEIPWLKNYGPIPKLANELIAKWFASDTPFNRTRFHFHDPVVIAAYLNPKLFEFKQISLTVDCSSSKFRGQTTVLSNKGNTQLAIGVKSSETKHLIHELLNC